MEQRVKTILLLGLIVGIFMQCGRPGEESTESIPDFHSDVAAFTSGLISAESTIQVQFARDFPDSVASGTALRKEVLSFSPDLKGSVYYLDQRTIEFRPDERMPQGTTYSARVRLNRLFPGHAGEGHFEFNFHTITQHVEISVLSSGPYNDYDPRSNYLSGTLVTADVSDPAKVETIVKALQGETELPVSWDHGPNGKQHQFTIDSVRRTDVDTEVSVHYDGSVIDAAQKGVEKYPIPALGSFRVVAHKVVQYPEQHVVVSFSDPILKQQYLNGLLRLDTDTDLRFSVEGNNILIYPVVRQSGTMNLYVEPGIKNVAGKGLSLSESLEVVFEQIKPAIQLLGSGVIIPGSDKVQLPFKAVNLKAVEVKVIKIYENNIAQFLQVNPLGGNRELKRAGRLIHKKRVDLLSDRSINYGTWNTFSLDLTELVRTEPGALYRVELGFSQQHSLFPCGEEQDQTPTTLSSEEDSESLDPEELSYWDSYESYYSSYDYYSYEGYRWEDREDPCKPAYYGKRRNVSRNILASNLGLIAKKGGGNELHVTVTDLMQATPLSGARVIAYNFQNQVMAEGNTQSDGTALLSLTGKPFLVVAEQGKEKGYLKLNDGSALSYSMFDVSGAVVQKGLKGFLYGERGVWRPGDSLYLSFILDDALNPIPESHPVIFELRDPRGKQVQREVAYGNGTGFYTFFTATSSDALTGRYTAIARVGEVEFSRMIRVETVKPNRLKINLTFPRDTLFPGMGRVRGMVGGRWLTGAIARNLKTEVEVTLRAAATSFSGYSGFTFLDPTRELISQPVQFFSGSLNESGEAQFARNLEITGEAPGMLNAVFTTRLFEQSGEFSIDQLQVPCSPYRTYVGIKPPEGDRRGMLLTDTSHSVRVVTLDASGNPVSRVGLQVDVYKLDWRWWWETSTEDLSSYTGRNYHTPTYSTTISTVNGEGSFRFRIDYPDWGRYLVHVKNGANGHAAGKIVYVDWPGWAGRAKKGDPDAASVLTFSADKTKYQVGEEAVVSIPSSLQGRLLISLENGTRVLRQEWIEASGAETRYSFRITPDMTPNIYVYASLIQPHSSTINDLPIRLYGVLPLTIEDPETRLEPVIDMPDELSPNSQVKIGISEASGKEMTYTIAMVDEGLLDLTRFKTPDPWSTFYAREALGVRTWDMFEEVLGAQGGRIDGMYNIGGGEDEGGDGSREANRFPPMVRFLGPYTLAGKQNSHTIEMPNYIGSVRTMVIAGKDGAYGRIDKTTPVKQPLMVLATLPRVLGPGEEVSLPVNIFVMDEKVKQVKVQVQTNSLLKAESSSETVTFETTGDKIVEFRLTTAELTGTGKVSVEVSSGREKASYDIELNIRSSNPPVTAYQTAVIDPGEAFDLELDYLGMPGTNEFYLEVSSVPPVDFGRRLKYLLNFPHGCIEQTTSAAFPQLYLKDVMEIDERVRIRTEQNVKSAIQRITSFQLNDGSFSYWPGATQSSSWGTSYAGHFLLEARDRGYDVSATLMNQWKKYQKRQSRRWSSSGKRVKSIRKQEQLLQAYRLFTLALAGEPELGAMNRLRERSDLTHETRWRLAAAYALSGQQETARDLSRNASTEVAPYSDSRYSFGSDLRDRAMILEAMVLMDMRDEAVPVMEEVSSSLSGERWMSTQTTAYSLLALAKFTGTRPRNEDLKFRYELDGTGKNTAETSMAVARVEGDPGTGLKAQIHLTNLNNGIIYLRMVNTGIPYLGNEQAMANNLTASVEYTDMAGNPLDVSGIPQGSDFKAVYTVSHPGILGALDNLALTTMYPSGWEIHNERLFNTMDESASFDFQDIRDDRIMTYFGLGTRKKASYTVRLNAAYRGRFYLPSVRIDAMYRNDVQVLIPGRWVEVESVE